MRRSADFRLLCFADSVAGIEIMQTALAGADCPRAVDIVIDVGSPGGRTGCRDVETAVAVAEAVRAADRLRLVGAGGFELGGYPAIGEWLARVASEPGHVPIDA